MYGKTQLMKRFGKIVSVILLPLLYLINISDKARDLDWKYTILLDVYNLYWIKVRLGPFFSKFNQFLAWIWNSAVYRIIKLSLGSIR